MTITENKYFIFDHPKIINLKYIIKEIIRLPFYFVFKIISLFCYVKPIEKKYKVSICAIFKNESLYLKEWIEYHRIVGVEHFYLYNNNSEDDYTTVLAPYIKEGFVTLIQWPQNQAQIPCYHNCLDNYSNETNWLAFIDIDEFIVPNSTNSIYDFLKPFEKKNPVVIAYWRMFGTSGKLTRNLTSLVTEDLTVCWKKYDSIGKIFFNTAFDLDKKNKKNVILHHYCWGKRGILAIPPVNVFGKICVWDKNPVPRNVDASLFPMHINHYFSKTYEEYIMKKSKGDVYFKVNPHDESYFFTHENRNCSSDYSIYKYLIKLKLAMQKK